MKSPYLTAFAMAVGLVFLGFAAENNGEQLYNMKCARCHGKYAEGIPGKGSAIYSGTGKEIVRSDAYDRLFRIIVRGGRQGMPRANIRDSEIEKIQRYVRELNVKRAEKL